MLFKKAVQILVTSIVLGQIDLALVPMQFTKSQVNTEDLYCSVSKIKIEKYTNTYEI